MADPEDSDVNSIFGALKQYESLKEKYDCEIATLTGYKLKGVEADTRIIEQFDKVLKDFGAENFVFVSDGASDDQILPLLQTRLPLISKKTIVVKQAKGLEQTYYTIKEALKDPMFSMIIFGLPGLALIAYYWNPRNLRLIAFVLGLYLLLKGTTLDLKIYSVVRSFIKQFSFERVSFVFYLTSVIMMLFGIWDAGRNYIFSDLFGLERVFTILSNFYGIFFFSILIFLLGRVTDLFYMQKAYKLKEIFTNGVFVIVTWIIVSVATKVLLNKETLGGFLLSVGIAFLLIIFMYLVSKVLDIESKVTKLLIGLPVFSHDGLFVGKVVDIEKEKGQIIVEIKDKKEKYKKPEFLLQAGRIILAK
jgi:putative membrane protein